MSTSPTIQYSGPRIEDDIPANVRRHLQLLYQKLGNHTQAFGILNQQMAGTAAPATSASGGGSTTSGAGILPVSGGGTGIGVMPPNSVLLGEGGAPVSAVSPAIAGYLLTDNGPGVNPSFQVLSVVAQSYAYADLPSSPVTGQIVVVTDAAINTWGAALTVGGGTDVVLAWWNGSTWNIIGK
jgi:hypothetical protein